MDELIGPGVGTVILSYEDRAFIKEHKALIDHYRTVAAALQASLVNRLRAGYGVDIDREDWELDIERGILTRRTIGTDTDVGTNVGVDVGVSNGTTTD